MRFKASLAPTLTATKNPLPPKKLGGTERRSSQSVRAAPRLPRRVVAKLSEPQVVRLADDQLTVAGQCRSSTGLPPWQEVMKLCGELYRQEMPDQSFSKHLALNRKTNVVVVPWVRAGCQVPNRDDKIGDQRCRKI
jgi:hypothetical protein